LILDELILEHEKMTENNLEQESDKRLEELVNKVKQKKDTERIQRERDRQKKADDINAHEQSYKKRKIWSTIIAGAAIVATIIGVSIYERNSKQNYKSDTKAPIEQNDTIKTKNPVTTLIQPIVDSSSIKPWITQSKAVHLDNIVSHTTQNSYTLSKQVSPITGQNADSNSTSKKSIANVVNEASRNPKTLTELNIPGNITSNYTIEAGNYVLKHFINISENGKLTINEGAVIQCDENSGITVSKGQLQILGKGDKPVVFNAKVHSWSGIRINDSKKQNLIQFTIIKNVKGYNYGAINVGNSLLDVKYLNIELCETGIISQYSAINIDHAIIKNNHNRGINGIGSKLWVNNSSITDNKTAENGGGIYLSQTYLTLDNVTIKNNSARSGGGIYEDINSEVQMFGNNTISDNIPDNIVQYKIRAAENDNKPNNY